MALARGDAVSAAFAAGAALAALDALVRREAPFAPLWRRRLALKAAVACVGGLGRNEDEAALRDALALTRPGDDPGPAGRVYQAFRTLADPGAARRLPEIGRALGASDGFAETLAAHARSSLPAPLAAAAAARAVAAAQGPRALGAAWAAADYALSQRLGWPAPLPLIAEELAAAGRPRPGEPGWDAACCAAYARAAARACDFYAEIAAAAARLGEVAPKLRAKGARAAVAALMEEDALGAGVEIRGLSERGLRRLFDRLVSLQAVRELSGRATFRLYGL
jgi:hypothetical protein